MKVNGDDIRFVGCVEMRHIPLGWQHPKDALGRWVPLLPWDYLIDGELPALRMPEPIGETQIVAYEAVTEGTPISPPFPDTPTGCLDLVNYCAEHCTTIGDFTADAEAWAAILFGHASVGIDGTVRAD
jgi:hypothetical protein